MVKSVNEIANSISLRLRSEPNFGSAAQKDLKVICHSSSRKICFLYDTRKIFSRTLFHMTGFHGNRVCINKEEMY